MGARDQAPVRLGPYSLLSELGQGGMGAVYRAEHLGSGGVHAVKVMTPQTPEDALRFLREAEGMARVEGHPHVLRIHASGQEQGWLWLAMEWAPGGSLEERLARGPLPIDALAPLGRALALGLAHIHARGVLHRDLKPANVLFGDDGQPKLADFGVARLRGAQALTQTGTIVGTPAYMAPEQAQAAGSVDERVDVYGLGAILYHAAAGRPPFQGGSTIAVLEAVIKGAPVDPRRLRPELPAWLARVILRALATSPDERHASATALAAALAGPTGSAWRRNALVAGGLALVTAGALGALALASGLRPVEEGPAPAPTPAPIRSALVTGPPEPSREVKRALQALEAIHDELERVNRIFVTVRAAGEGIELPPGPLPGLTFESSHADLATPLSQLGSLEPLFSRICAEAGSAALDPLMGTLASLFQDLHKQSRAEARAEGARHVTALLDSLVAVTEDTPERRSLAAVALWLRVARSDQLPPAQELDALARAAADPRLPAPYQRLLALGSLEVALKRGDGSLDALDRAERLLGPVPEHTDLLDPFRRAAEALADRYLRLAWTDRACRADSLARLEPLLARIPATNFHGALARIRVTAAFLSGREPDDVELRELTAGSLYRLLFEAELHLGRAQWEEAAERYREALKKSNQTLVDARTGLALALTLGERAEEGALVFAEVARLSGASAWIPWRSVEATRDALTRARAGTWAPSPGHPFPED